MAEQTVRIAAVADLHYHNGGDGRLRPLFTEISATADILLLCGDIIDYGLPDEARGLIKDMNDIAKRITILAVLGNHEFESGKVDEVSGILKDGGITILDGDACEVKGVGFAGVKGFPGGFGARLLEPWGEPIIKQFVREAIDEALKLESALARLRTPARVALLHYAPIAATVIGEPLEIFPFLGSSRLEEPLNRYPVAAVFHGHAHRGTPEGKTSGGVPVYNVAMKLLQSSFPDRPPCRMIELPITGERRAGASQPPPPE
ncbi:MAG TPA: metallophosphoesterase [Candidatus Binatia bacterium]|jgi:Icc-related predicted phosphoesterase